MAALVACGALVSVLPAQESDAPKKGESSEAEEPVRSKRVEKVDVRLKMVEVVVVDKRGRHVRGLPASAFEVQEDGTPVRIATFDEIDLTPPERRSGESVEQEPEEASPEPPEREAAPKHDAESNEAPEEVVAREVEVPEETEQSITARKEGQRWFVLLFDGYHNPSPLRISRARRAAKDWIEENMRPGDRAAVFEITPYLYTIKGFTSRPESLRAAVDKVRVMPGDSMREDMIRQRLEAGDMTPGDFFEGQLDNAAKFGARLDARERDVFYNSVISLTQALAPLDGTKAVVMFSGGFPLTRSVETAAAGGFSPLFRDMLEILEQTGIRFFTFDVGEEGSFTGAERDQSLRQWVDQLDLGNEWLNRMQIGMQIDALHAHHEILQVLGNETGGRFFRSRDYEEGLDRVSEDLSHYYLIGYEPIDPIKSKGFVPIDVEVDRSGLRAITRQGRYLEPSVTSAADTRETEDDAAFAPVAIRCEPRFYPHAGGRTLVVLPARLGPFLPEDASGLPPKLTLRLHVGARLQGIDVESVRRSIEIPLNETTLSQLSGGMIVRDALALPSSRFDLQLRIDLVELGRSAVWSETLPVPSRGTGQFALGELLVFSPTDRTPNVFDVFRTRQPIPGTRPERALSDPLGPAKGRPPLYSGGVLPSQVPLLVQTAVLAPPPPSEDGGESQLRLDWELVPHQAGETLAPPIRYRRLEPSREGQLLDVVADLDVSDVEPGGYTLRLTATNTVSGERAIREQAIRLAKVE